MTGKVKPCPACGQMPIVETAVDGVKYVYCCSNLCLAYDNVVELKYWSDQPYADRLRAQRDNARYWLKRYKIALMILGKMARRLSAITQHCSIESINDTAPVDSGSYCLAYIHNDQKQCLSCVLKYALRQEAE